MDMVYISCSITTTPIFKYFMHILSIDKVNFMILSMDTAVFHSAPRGFMLYKPYPLDYKYQINLYFLTPKECIFTF